mmetsp:Transcript_21919/g.36597  ORF Transcript_21919/g.36597 Transcript_21919/m.36597 type:complete len:210 (+) Transcript_21919:1088-1717(+)
MGQLGHDLVHHHLGQKVDVLAVRRHLVFGHLGCGPEPHAQRGGEGAAAQPALLAAAVHLRLEAHARAASDVQSPHPLRSVELMPADRHQVDLQIVHIHIDLPDRLGRVGVEKHALGAAQLADLFHRLLHADLVVDVHDGHERGVLADGRLELLHTDQAVGLHGQVGDIEALLLQHAARVQHTLMLRLCRDNMFLLALVEPGHAFDGDIV